MSNSQLSTKSLNFCVLHVKFIFYNSKAYVVLEVKCITSSSKRTSGSRFSSKSSHLLSQCTGGCKFSILRYNTSMSKISSKSYIRWSHCTYGCIFPILEWSELRRSGGRFRFAVVIYAHESFFCRNCEVSTLTGVNFQLCATSQKRIEIRRFRPGSSSHHCAPVCWANSRRNRATSV